AIADRDRYILQVADRLNSSKAANQKFAGALLVKISSGPVFVALTNGSFDLFERDTVTRHCIGIDTDLKLLALATHGKHLRNPRYREQTLADDPIRFRSQFHGGDIRIVCPHSQH